MECLARCGFVAKGVVYALVGALALEAALGIVDETTDVTDALRILFQQPGGRIHLALLVVGFFGYALWRSIQAIWDPEPRKRGAAALIYRAAYAISGLTYGALGCITLRILIGLEFNPHSGADWYTPALTQPLGRLLASLAGAVGLGMGAYFLHRAYTAHFQDELSIAQMSAAEVRWVTLAGRVGHAARAVVFSLAGAFLLRGALHANPREIRGVGGILSFLAHYPYGQWLLGGMAAGLLLYGAYMFVAARYRRLWA